LGGGMTGEDPLAGFEAKIRGRVQGVGFRYHTQRFAKELNVTGWVRNQKDGSVRVVARGRRAALEAFIAFLRIGPNHASVDEMDTDWARGGNDFREFTIRS
jgi:acylphosphatase|tara:strand:- start:1927 stop:2229 length:303 start_codon:yes stop_codon:yes gene_type:complete